MVDKLILFPFIDKLIDSLLNHCSHCHYEKRLGGSCYSVNICGHVDTKATMRDDQNVLIVYLFSLPVRICIKSMKVTVLIH